MSTQHNNWDRKTEQHRLPFVVNRCFPKKKAFGMGNFCEGTKFHQRYVSQSKTLRNSKIFLQLSL